MIEKAITNRWPISEKHRKAVVERMAKIITGTKSSNREVVAAARALIQAESQNQADEHHDAGDLIVHQGRIEHVGVKVMEDVNWYDNDAHGMAAQGAQPPDASLALPGPVQGSGVRPAVGQNGHGANGHG